MHHYPDDFARFTLARDDVEVVEVVQAQPLDRETKADCLAGMSLLSGLVYARESVSAIFFKEGLMDIIRESPVAQYLTQQGIEQGIEREVRERAIEDLLDVLEIRFALGAADPLAARIRGIEDLQRLKQLHRAACVGTRQSLRSPRTDPPRRPRIHGRLCGSAGGGAEGAARSGLGLPIG